MTEIENVVNRSCSTNLLFLKENNFQQKCSNFTQMYKSLFSKNVPYFCRLTITSIYKISKFPLSMSIFKVENHINPHEKKF